MKRGPTGQAPSNRPSKRASIRAPSPNTLISPGEGGAAASSAIVKFVCVKRAAVRDGCDQQTSRRTGFVNVGACINALERRTNENGVVRVRFERGWVSCTSQKGDLLLQPVVGPPRPVIKGCRCCGKIGHLKAKCPDREHRCATCGKARFHIFECPG